MAPSRVLYTCKCCGFFLEVLCHSTVLLHLSVYSGHGLYQGINVRGCIGHAVCGLFDRTADALNCLCHLHHCRQYILRLARILCHRVVDVGRIIIVLLTSLHKCTVIRQNVLVDITNNLLRRNNQSLYCLNYLLIDRLDIVRCLTRRICELSDLICYNCKSLSGFTGTRRLNRCIQCKQIRLAGNI